jgi:surface polysaccharide O-acyltransferase-like enzyme
MIPLWIFIVAFFIYILYKIYLLKRNINNEKPKRKYYYLIFLIIVALIPMFLFISIFPFGKKTMEEIKNLSDEELIIYVNETRIYNPEIEKIVETFNYCEIDEDCESFS